MDTILLEKDKPENYSTDEGFFKSLDLMFISVYPSPGRIYHLNFFRLSIPFIFTK